MFGIFCFAVILPPPATFEGGLLGVHARVTLEEDKHRAIVTLRGIPVGGVLHGIAWFADDGSVILDPKLDRGMRLRLCSVHEVVATEDRTEVRVVVKLPLFGRRALRLQRIASPVV